MKNKILLISLKELNRFFGDKRMILSALIFPFILLFSIYSFLVPNMLDLFLGNINNSLIYTMNQPTEIDNIFKHFGIKTTAILETEIDSILKGIEKKDGNYLIIYPVNFYNNSLVYDMFSGKDAPEIYMYYNSQSANFLDIQNKINTVFSIYEKIIAKKYDINLTGGGDLAAKKGKSPNILTALLPVFLLVFIFYGAVTTSSEAITGEKERGTLSTILITSIKTIELAVGKIFGLSILTCLCGVSSSLAIILSMPNFTKSLNQGLSALALFNPIDITQFSLLDFFILLFIILSISFFIVAFVVNISILAKNTKEAQMLLSPLLIVIMLIGLLGTLSNTINQENMYNYIIPIYNSVQCMNSIFNKVYTPLKILLTISSNICYSILGAIILSRLLKVEKFLQSS